MPFLLIATAPLDHLTTLLPHLEAAPRPLAGAARAVAEEALVEAVRTCELLVAYGIGVAGKPSRN